MEELINYLLHFRHLNREQIELIKSKGVWNSLKKGEYYSEAGTIPGEVAFLTEGIFRVFHYNKKGDEITKFFVDENHFVVDINSYNESIPSSEYIEAITDCTYIVISKQSMTELSATINVWDEIVKKITSKGLSIKYNKISAMLTEPAIERYLNFSNTYPRLAGRVPLAYLASYLGMTATSLSRIRKNIYR